MARFAATQTNITDATNILADHCTRDLAAVTSNAAASPVTLTAAQVLGGGWLNTTNGAFSAVLPTAALLLAAIPNPQNGTSGWFFINNSGNNTVTVTGGTNVSIVGTATLPTATGQMFFWKIVDVTGVANPSVTFWAVLKTAS